MRILLIAFLTIAFKSYSQTYPTGAILDDDKYIYAPRLSPALGLTIEDLPNRPTIKSLKPYCPIPGNQGAMGSCAGWATGYAALTIADAIRNNITDKTQITNRAKSALYIYNQIRYKGLNNDDCSYGAVIEDAFKLVSSKGNCSNSSFNPNKCDILPTENENAEAQKFKVSTYKLIFDYNPRYATKSSIVKEFLSKNYPIVIGMNFLPSMWKLKGQSYWQPTVNDAISGGHALCVIGYDDTKRTFELINSWGENWGDGGFFTISYENFEKYAKYGYSFELEKNTKNSTPIIPILSGNFNFKKYKGQDINNNNIFENTLIANNGNYYTLMNSVNKDDYFRLEATNLIKESFVYIFSIKPDNSTELIFPTSNKIESVSVRDLAIIPTSNTSINFPIDPKKALKADQKGNDAVYILYSKQEIKDIDIIIQNIKNNRSSDLYAKLKSALGTKLIPQSEINYSTSSMSATSNSSNGYIIPIVLKLTVTE
jgi:Papain family cysteine protease